MLLTSKDESKAYFENVTIWFYGRVYSNVQTVNVLNGIDLPSIIFEHGAEKSIFVL